ncbi:hypothetical protein [Pontibacter sp. BAB1700]|uniref:hypothetical protein n=1 Tax=Pontibacter sp. BAB1700 TaxID=1144253 RepID=UPI00026BD1A3|nr:hypothetical protein [Pontibacter sp. BAB1700]EJF10949.1 hypothetical protein O71_06092 [Pontibacter sp. BAB1700]
MRWTICLVLLLCSCATQRQDSAPVASKPGLPKLYAPAVYAKPDLGSQRLRIETDRNGILKEQFAGAEQPLGTDASARITGPYPVYKEIFRTQTVYLTDTVALDSLHRELQIEQLANQAIRKRLKSAEGERDFWQEKNEQKFWTLIAMAVFAFLYILFRLLASRIKET